MENSGKWGLLLLQFQLHSLILGDDAEWAFLNHESHDLVKDIGGSHSGELGIGVICRRNLDNIRCDEVDTFETTNDCAEFSR